MVFLPEELFCRRPMSGVVGVLGHVAGWGAVESIPGIVTGGPGQLCTEGGHQVVDTPGQDGVVVHRHVQVYHTDGVTYT